MPALAAVILFKTMLPLHTSLGALDDLWEFLKRVQEWLTLGGLALAAVIALLFLGTWVLAHLRQPGDEAKPVLPTLALASAYAPVLLTLAATAGLFIPGLQPLMIKCFALAVVLAAVSWCIAAAAILSGGSARDLARARQALLLAGTPWYCLIAYLTILL